MPDSSFASAPLPPLPQTPPSLRKLYFERVQLKDDRGGIVPLTRGGYVVRAERVYILFIEIPLPDPEGRIVSVTPHLAGIEGSRDSIRIPEDRTIRYSFKVMARIPPYPTTATIEMMIDHEVKEWSGRKITIRLIRRPSLLNQLAYASTVAGGYLATHASALLEKAETLLASSRFWGYLAAAVGVFVATLHLFNWIWMKGIGAEDQGDS